MSRQFFLRDASLALIIGLALAKPLQADDFSMIRGTWTTQLSGGTNYATNDSYVIAKTASINSWGQSQWNSLNKATNRTYLFSDLTSSNSNSYQVTEHFYRLRAMAQAFGTRGCPLYGNTNLSTEILSALEWLRTHRYVGTPYALTNQDNWWDWTLGSPVALVDILMYLHDDLTLRHSTRYTAVLSNYQTALQSYRTNVFSAQGYGGTFASFSGTGANLADVCRTDIGLGTLSRSTAWVQRGRTNLSPLFLFVTSGDGFYSDGSFIQHDNDPSNGGYGMVLLRNITLLREVLAGTSFDITDPNFSNYYLWLERAFQPLIWRGAFMDMVVGRTTSRNGHSDHRTALTVLDCLLRAARFGPTNLAAEYRTAAKTWIQSDTYLNYTNMVDLPAGLLAREVLTNPAIPVRTNPSRLILYPGMDRAVFQRSDFALGLALSSTRVDKYESINGENLKGWHQGDGVTFLYQGDLAQFSEGYWATVDPSRLPGITVDRRTRTNAQGFSYSSNDTTNTWAGGSSVLDQYGAVGMDLDAPDSEMNARKSWFFFDREVVCLGAGITTSATNTNRVETVVENRRFSSLAQGTPFFSVNGSLQSSNLSPATNLITNATWAHLTLNTSSGGADTGYVFPSPISLSFLRESRTSSIATVNTNVSFTSTNPLVHNYLTLWLNHGQGLTQAVSYAYILLPNASAAETAAYLTNSGVVILTNSPAVQAVKKTQLNATLANFWQDGAPAVEGIVSSHKASVSAFSSNGVLYVGMADPTQTNRGTLRLTLPYRVARILARPTNLTVVSSNSQLVLDLGLAGGNGGQTFSASFELLDTRPTGTADQATTAPGVPLAIPVLANDLDPEPGPLPLFIRSVGSPASGQAWVSGNSIRYTPFTGFSGTDTFSYVLSDGESDAEAVVTVQMETGSIAFSGLTWSSQQVDATNSNYATNVLDGNFTTRWSSQGTNEWLQAELGGKKKIQSCQLAYPVFSASPRTNFFSLEVSTNGTTWEMILSTNVLANTWTNSLQNIPLAERWATHVRLKVHGNVVNGVSSVWNSYSEWKILSASNLPPVASPVSRQTPETVPVTFQPLVSAYDPDAGPENMSILSWSQPVHGTVTREGDALIYSPAVGFLGTENFTARLSDGGAETLVTLSAEVSGIRTFTGYQNSFFNPTELAAEEIGGSAADPDADGLNNLVEYMLGSSPQIPSSLPFWIQVLSDGSVQIRYQRRPDMQDFSPVLEKSSDLASWSPVTEGTETVSPSPSPPLEQVDRILAPSSQGSSRFYRLRAVPNP